jgi:CheY-like chemotaxis protein
VLLVDDDDLIQSSTHALLDVLGHQTVAVYSGEEALAQLEAGYQPDIVLLDLNMPGLGGAGTLPRLRQLRPDLPVLLATGRADQSAHDLVQTYARVTLLSKPFGIRELRRQLEAFGTRELAQKD